MNNKFLLILPIFLFSFFIVSAITPDYIIKQGESFDLKRSCINNGTWCSGSAVCNITSQSPTGNILISNQRMTNQISFNNYTLAVWQTMEVGYFLDTITCCDSGNCGADTFYHQVTPSGSSNILGFFIMIFLISYGITLWGAYARHVIMTIFGGMIMIIVGLYTLINGFDIYRNMATQGLALFTIGIGAYWAITAGLELIDN